MRREGTLPRLAAFAALAVVAALQWASLLSDPEAWRFALAVALAVAAAVALLALASARGRVRPAATVLVGIVAALAGLAAVGIPAADLLTGDWGAFGFAVEDGIERLRGSLEYPLPDRGGIASALLMATLPIGLAVAAVLAFRPGRRSESSIPALCLLLALFAVPATIRPTEAPLAWGVVALALVCAWLWAPRVRAPAAIAVLGCAGALALPAASSLAEEDALIDYSEWGLDAPPDGVDFGWDHGYGPIDWSRTGTPLFEVQSDEPRYWRASVLDEFYAYGWRRSPEGGPSVPEPSAEALERWTSEATISVRGLESRLLVSPGAATNVEGIEDLSGDFDGTVNLPLEPLAQGTNYSVTAYAPEPGAARMRAASQSYPEALLPYTRVAIPFVSAPLGTSQAIEPLTPATFQVPLWGSASADADIAEGIADSPYARTVALSRRLTADQPSAYDAVLAVQEFLRDGYEYDERPPERRLPIPAFLFRDRIGYCQQFSGAMAMMLRVSGIPARVATGFSPGALVSGTDDTYEVTDLDAHSWVEVYFDGIGWVPFDPTPAAAPAESQSDGSGAGSAAPGGGGVSGKDLESEFGGAADGAAAGPPGGADGTPAALQVLLCLLALAMVGSVVAAGRAFAFRRLPADVAREAELAELIPALRASGREAQSSMTLLDLEARLRDGGRRAGAAYAAALRDARYRGAGATGRPTLGQRRAVRRELASGGGLLRRLRLLAAMPPGAPRARR